MGDFATAIAANSPSAAASDIVAHEPWAAKFGSS